MSKYMQFLSEKIKQQEKNNEQIVLDYWEKVANSGDISSKYESLVKKMITTSEEECVTYQEMGRELNNLKGFAKRQVLKHWVIKAERQNLNEKWKQEYLTSNSNMELHLLPKSGANSLHLSHDFKIEPRKKNKLQSDKSKGIKSFDFVLKNSNYPNTLGFDGILVVDKTVKVTGGSQIDVQKEIDNTISHLCNDPLKRKYLFLLDGKFFMKYVQENKGKCENVIFTTTDELIKEC